MTEKPSPQLHAGVVLTSSGPRPYLGMSARVAPAIFKLIRFVAGAGLLYVGVAILWNWFHQTS